METKNQILIVEDAVDIQVLLTNLLEMEGYDVKTADNGQEAIDLLKSSTELPGLILLDLMMPVMDGYVFRREQEKDPRLSAIPVVVMTADGDYQSKSARIGAKGYLKKPFTKVEDILSKIEQFFP